MREVRMSSDPLARDNNKKFQVIYRSLTSCGVKWISKVEFLETGVISSDYSFHEVIDMKTSIRGLILVLAALLFASSALAADSYSKTVELFRNAGASAQFFHTSYGYAIFPTIGKAGFIVGAAHGKGRVYEQGRLVGDVSMNQLSVGFQLGGQAYSEIIFFENKGAFDEFTSGNFEFGAGVSVVAITAAAGARASTSGGASAGASGGKHDAVTSGAYRHGVAVFTIAKGGLMYQAAVQGQKFTYKARGSK